MHLQTIFSIIVLIVFGIYFLYLHLKGINPEFESVPTKKHTCQDHSNNSVDWFIIYKLPIQTHSSDPSIANGTGYLYLDSNSSLNQWHSSSVSISSPNSLTGLTLARLYESNEDSYIFYNDQPPNMPISMSYGHSKGILSFDEVSESGFWLIHSVPHFPNTVSKGYGYPDSGRTYGQTFLCITIDASAKVKSNSIDFLSNHFLYTRPLIFESRLSLLSTQRYSILSDAIINKKAHIDEPPYTLVSRMNHSSLNLEVFSKYGLSNIDMLAELIAPTLKTSMFSETWSNGRQINLPSNCTGSYNTINIEQLSWNFTVHHDHSKWLVADNSSWICIGDMNRQAEQKVRHGGFVCIDDIRIQQRFRKLILSADSCPIVNYTLYSYNFYDD